MLRRSFLKLASAAGGSVYSGLGFAQSTFRLTLIRTFESDNCTTGELYVNGEFLCHTLELPWQNNRSFISSIPSSIYGANIRYDKSDHWRIELKNDDTQPRSYVQIHIGNTPKDLKGCISTGMEVINAQSKLVKSAVAYGRLKNAFYGTDAPISTPDKEIKLEIRYNVAPTEFIVRDDDAGTEARYRQDGVSWLLFSDSASGRHVWDEITRTDAFIVFRGVRGSGFWEDRYIRFALHGGGDMQISDNNSDWSTFGEGTKIIRKDGTSRI
jgi:hypothetical protein